MPSRKQQKSWTTNHKTFQFVDLFAGIGGFRIALEQLGGECVFSSEWDPHSMHTYEVNFGDLPEGDITKIDEKIVPSHHIVCAGFPCQAFSISGKRKGFADTRGTLFFDIARIVKEREPHVVFLENVKNFARHDNGNTLNVVISTLEDLGYNVFHTVLRSSDFGVPQARERIYIVAFHNKTGVTEFSFPEGKGKGKVVKDVLEKNPVDAKVITRNDISLDSAKNVTDTRRPLQIGRISKGGQGERIYSVDSAGITLSAYGGGVASKTGAYLVGKTIRKLSPRECARLQGFPEDFEIPVSSSVAYRQFGDSVSIPVIVEIGKKILKAYQTPERARGSKTAKDGFKNEDYVVSEFNNWKHSKYASLWLEKMGYASRTIQSVHATRISGHKTDVQVEISQKDGTHTENLQVKLVSNPKGFNQVDKRWVTTYKEMWNIPPRVYTLLRHFSGELAPRKKDVRDARRMFADEFSKKDQEQLVQFFKDNKTRIVSDILKGNGKFAARWMLVILKEKNDIQWGLEPIQNVIKHFGAGDVSITPRGSIKIGKVTIQRKGGDAGRDTANMLQFKINPSEIVRK